MESFPQLHPENRSKEHFFGYQPHLPFVASAFQELGFNDRLELELIVRPLVMTCETGIFCKIRAFHGTRQSQPKFLAGRHMKCDRIT